MSSLKVYLEVFRVLLLKLQLKLILSIPDSYQLFLSPSENFRLPEVLPDAPPIVPLIVPIEVHLEVLTFSDHA